jgi:two-component system CheB/CheR fusion protein
VDKEFRVQVWNDRSTDLWGVRQDEAEGAHLLDLDVGFDVGQLRQPIREVLSGVTEYRELVLSGINRRGRPIQCRITIAPLRGVDRKPNGAILLMEEQALTAA